MFLEIFIKTLIHSVDFIRKHLKHLLALKAGQKNQRFTSLQDTYTGTIESTDHAFNFDNLKILLDVLIGIVRRYYKQFSEFTLNLT